MNTETFSIQKRVRAMGTALAVVSILGLLFWGGIAVNLLLFSSWSVDPTYFERLVGEDAPDPKVATDEELRNHFETHFAEAKPVLPDGVTKEIYANTMIYFTKMRAGEVIGGFMLPDTDDWADPDLAFLPGGLTAESTVREVILKDRAFFEAHMGAYRLLVIICSAFFSIVSFVILRMALSWRRGDPFGPGTILGLRRLGVLFLVQFIASFLLVLIVPESGFALELVIFSSLFDDLATDLGSSGASLSCGIVFLTLSWVLDYGRKMKEEQALTI